MREGATALFRPYLGRWGAPQMAACAVATGLFFFYLLGSAVLSPATVANWERADPIVRIVPASWAVPLVLLLGGMLPAVWLLRARPSREDWSRAAAQLGLGIVAAVAACLILRWLVGPSLPDVIPPEESAGPGFTLSMTAGYGEELVFRLVLLPALYLGLRDRIGITPAVVVAVTAVGLGFAAMHEIGPGAFDSSLALTRFLIPGVVMSMGAIVIGPAFVVAAHCAAHMLIPALFVGPS